MVSLSNHAIACEQKNHMRLIIAVGAADVSILGPLTNSVSVPPLRPDALRCTSQNKRAASSAGYKRRTLSRRSAAGSFRSRRYGKEPRPSLGLLHWTLCSPAAGAGVPQPGWWFCPGLSSASGFARRRTEAGSYLSPPIRLSFLEPRPTAIDLSNLTAIS